MPGDDTLEPRAGADAAGRMAHWRRVVAAEPDNLRALDELGQAAAHAGDLALAGRCFTEALTREPRSVSARNNLANVLWRLGRAEEAERHWRACIALAPGDAAAFINLGHLLLRQERGFEESLALLARGRDLRPDHAPTWRMMGAVLRRLNRADEAVAALEESRRRAPDEPATHYQLGLALRAAGRPEAAREHLEKTLSLRPDDVFARASLAGVEAALGPPPALGARARRVAVHINQRFHYALLRPLFDALAGQHHAHFTSDGYDMAAFGPEVVIVADAQARGLRPLCPDAVYVQTRHGLISKNHAFDLARDVDYVCVASESAKEEYLRRDARPRRGFWITGFVQTDPLFRGGPADLPFATAPGRKTVLFAPTFNPALSGAPMLGARAVELLRGTRTDVSVIIKPHPHICEHIPEWMAWWRPAAERDPHVHLVDDPGADLVPYLKAADVLVSDASSAAFMYLALDRPVVLLTNPQAAEDAARFDAQGIEWQWRDMGEEVRAADHLPAAVDRALAGPRRHAPRRAEYRRRLFGALTDGRAVERIVAHVTGLEP